MSATVYTCPYLSRSIAPYTQSYKEWATKLCLQWTGPFCFCGPIKHINTITFSITFHTSLPLYPKLVYLFAFLRKWVSTSFALTSAHFHKQTMFRAAGTAFIWLLFLLRNRTLQDGTRLLGTHQLILRTLTDQATIID